MLSAGEMLLARRLETKLTFTQASELTKIPATSLKALEKNQLETLPAYPFLKGMVRNYAQALGMDPVKVVAVFKRDYDRRQKKINPVILNKSLGPTPLIRWLEKPQTLFLAGIVLLAVLVGWSLWRVYQPPRLVIETPVSGQTAISPVEIKGKTDRDASLSLNGRTLNLNPDGSFETVYAAEPGMAEITLQATSRRQKTSEKTIKIVIID